MSKLVNILVVLLKRLIIDIADKGVLLSSCLYSVSLNPILRRERKEKGNDEKIFSRRKQKGKKGRGKKKRTEKELHQKAVLGCFLTFIFVKTQVGENFENCKSFLI